MKFTKELVSWNKPENMGPIKGAEWVWPADWEAVKRLVARGVEITDDVLMKHANGQRRYAEGIRYPEGYEAVRVMSKGAAVNSPDSLERYGGLTSPCNCDGGNRPLEPFMESSALLKNSIVLGNGRTLKALNSSKGIESRITPLIQYARIQHASAVKMTTATICPEKKSFSIQSMAQAPNSENGVWTDLSIGTIETDPKRSWASLTVKTLDESSSLTLNIDHEGFTTVVRPYGKSILNVLGITTPQIVEAAEHGRAWEGYDCYKTASPVMSAIGYPDAGLLDLHGTAMAVYRDMGNPSFSPVDVFSFR